MENGKSIDKADMVLGLFLDSMTTNFPNRRPAQSNQKLKQKQISQKNKDQEGRCPHDDPIPMSYTQLLPILVNARAIMPKQIEPAKFPYHREHGLHSTCGYHAGYVGPSTEACHVLKSRIQELIDQKLLRFTHVIVEAPVEKRFEYNGPLICVQVHPPMVQLVTQYPNQGYHPVNPGLVFSAQTFRPMAIPPIRPLLHGPLMPMSCYSFPPSVTSQYQQPPHAQVLKNQQTVPRNHQGKK
ncbi:hypothetical protein KIW84_022616 [Lathyrus oleraceus]|uniref:Uncharacterized protein n=1 Tax=Pisum sativum TaxID=3888 RepID=A0A9D4YFC0_PEA|nr:hypothetical protein KIW84_022616 [Pisum sativum]